MLKIISLITFLFISLAAFQQPVKPPIFNVGTNWADSILSSMTLEQKIGQLIMVTTYPEQGVRNEKQVELWIKNQHIGGVLFLKTKPDVLKKHTEKYQKSSPVPLFIALDAENGLSFRMDSVVKYPHLIGLGSVADNKLIYQMGREVGIQCKLLGINVNFSPVADVNSNPENPIINYRSFGENAQNVAAKTYQLAKGMQDEKIMVAVKHFPGHGDTSFDSHLVLPSIERTYKQLDSIDFAPFKLCIDNGINGIMTAHISIPKVDISGRPSTLSKTVMTDILRDSLGFEGIVFSDGMNMQGITRHFDEGNAAVEALKAGVDVLEFVLNPALVIASVKKAIEKGELTDSMISKKCHRVLLAKTWLGLNINETNKETSKNISDINFELTARKLYMNSLTVIQNDDSILPLRKLDTLKIASLAIGCQTQSIFQTQLEKYMGIDHFFVPANASEQDVKKIVGKLKTYNLVIAGVFNTRMAASSNFAVKEYHKQTVDQLTAQNNTILTFFGSPYSLVGYKNLDKAKGILVAYGEHDYSQGFAAQLIFGAIGSNSKLPVSINSVFPEGKGHVIEPIGRLSYGIPEEEGFKSSLLKNCVDSMVTYGIGQKMFPGCQVLVAKNGKVIFQESYGHYTYEKQKAVNNQSMFDIASITKIVGPLPLIMKLIDNKTWHIDSPFSAYYEMFKGTNKEKLTLKQMLLHQAGFKPGLNLVYNISKPQYKDIYIRDRPSTDFPTRISTSLYIKEGFDELMYESIVGSELSKVVKYEYSDLPFYLFPSVLSKWYNNDYDTVLDSFFLNPLGAGLTYNPYLKYPVEGIVPTENDNLFRNELVQGFVHDEGAAILGGVSGNAGLFSNANELAKIMQFYLNKGSYGDFCFLKKETIELFTKSHSSTNRRGLGFDKPYADNAIRKTDNYYPAKLASASSYGHTGFTGTITWADPSNNLIFIFLSNRVYPTRENKKLGEHNFRPMLHQLVYECQNTFSPTHY